MIKFINLLITKIFGNHTSPRQKLINAQIKLKRAVFKATHKPTLAPPPAVVYVIVNSRCNLFCKMCDVGQANTESQFAQNMLSVNSDMDLDVFKKIVDEVKKFKPLISLHSTEPLLWKHLKEAVIYAKQNKCKVEIGTNALLLPKLIDFLNPLLDSLSVSIDGQKEMHDYIRGSKHSFDNATQGFSLSIAKSRRINHVVTQDNYKDLANFATQIAKYKPTIVSFSHLNFITQEMANTHNKHFKDIAVATKTCDYLDFEQIDYALMLDQLNKAEEILTQKGIAVSFTPRLSSVQEAKDYFTNHKKIIAKKECRVPWEQAQFMANGDLIIMTRCFHKVMGNIKDKSFNEIWNSTQMQDFRQALIKYKIFPACTRCCGVL